MKAIGDEYRAAAEKFRRKIGAGPLEGTLAAAGEACAEARAALMRAGISNKEMDRQLLATQRKLQSEARRE